MNIILIGFTILNALLAAVNIYSMRRSSKQLTLWRGVMHELERRNQEQRYVADAIREWKGYGDD